MTIRVLVADDSPFLCRLMTQYLESDPEIRVIKTAVNGKDAADFVMTLKPDVATLDLNMPVLNGIDALRRIMTECPTPVVLISGVSKQAARMIEKGLSSGAVDFIFKYSPETAISPALLRKEIIAKVRAAARVKVIRSIPSIRMRISEQQAAAHLPCDSAKETLQLGDKHRMTPSCAVIGASTGGPLALKELLSSLEASVHLFQAGRGRDFSFPIVIVQHLPEGFTKILADQFCRIFSFPVREAAEGDMLYPGTVLIAPGDRHLLIGVNRRLSLSTAPKVGGHRPSIDVTMQSAAQTFCGQTIGVLLSGMGDDGTEGLQAIRNMGGKIFVQSRESCAVDAMPYAAIRKGIVCRIGTPAEIGRWLGEKR
jgi:two-component system, chemotaxis family, protein-glutamate methylesterase/glutaminase